MSDDIKNLSEAALEILNANKQSKIPSGEVFGQGASLNDTVNKGADCIGNANFDKYKLDVDQAIPPGQTPPVGAEPIKKLKPQPAEISIADTQVPQAPQGSFANEDIEALMSGENLSEDFKRKAISIFESAVKEKVLELSEEMETIYNEQFEKAFEELQEEMDSKIDSYLDYVVEQWMEENTLAIENGIKLEIAESFIESLKQVFEEHYINIPEEKFDVVEELASKVEALESKVNEQMQKNINLKEQLNSQKKKEILSSVCEGLTMVQAEKIKTIAESVDFSNATDFAEQIKSIKESYYASTDTVKPASKESLMESTIIEDTETKVVDPVIAAYASKLSKTILK